MTIRLRLIAVFACTIVSLMAMEYFSIELYKRMLQEDQEIRQRSNELVQQVEKTQITWRRQVQAWENVLLRFYNPEQFHRSLKQFYQQERQMRETLQQLRTSLVYSPQHLATLTQLQQEIRDVGLEFRNALQMFDGSISDTFRAADHQLMEAATRPETLLQQLQTALAEEREAQISVSKASVESAVRRIQIGEGIATLLLMGLLLWLIQRNLGLPLEKLTAAARQISKGDLKVRIRERLPGEFKWVSSAFNQMTEGLQRTTESLQGKVRELEAENQIRTQAEQELKDLTENLLQAQKEIESHAANLEKAVDERTRALWHQANYDRLTGLPNRALFNDRLNQTLHEAKRYNHQVALLYLDLDHFKRLNDTMGHDAGDHLLSEAAQRLKSAVRESDTVARLGGDEFVIILSEVQQDSDAAHVAEKVLALFQQPFIPSEGMETYLSASIGISFYPQDGNTRSDLLKHADAAMYRAKEEGRNQFAYYTVDISNEILKRLKIEHELRKSDFEKDFYLCYQPLVDIASQRIVGAEALLRWEHPTQGLISPVDFIPAAEDTGLIIELGKQTLLKACQQQVQWREQGLPAIRIAINISPVQFSHPTFLTDLQTLITKTGIEPSDLELEITESCLMLHAADNIALLSDLKALGLSLSIDDFGTGYSSLNYLKRFPVDNLKIDKSFVLDVLDDASDIAICKAVVALGQSLGINVIAEGVETAEHQAVLEKIGCHELQGYYLGRPQIAGKFEQLLVASRAPKASNLALNDTAIASGL